MWANLKSQWREFTSKDKDQILTSENAYKVKKPRSVSSLMMIKAEIDPDGRWFKYCNFGTGAVGALSGMFVYSSFRQALVLYEGLIIGHFFNGMFSMGFSYGVRKHFYQDRILTGQLRCLPCAMIQGSLLQVICASLIPFGLSFGFTGVIATKFGHIEIPSLGFHKPSKEFWDFWSPKFRSIRRRMIPLVILQVAASTFFTYKEVEAAEILMKKLTPEEVNYLGCQMLREINI